MNLIDQRWVSGVRLVGSIEGSSLSEVVEVEDLEIGVEVERSSHISGERDLDKPRLSVDELVQLAT